MAEPVIGYVQTILHRPPTVLNQGLRERRTQTAKNGKARQNILKRGKTWSCIYYEYDPIKNKRKPVWKGGFKTAEEARKARVKLQAEADAREGIKATDMTFKAYFEYYMKLHEGHLKPPSEKYYYRVFKYTDSIKNKKMRDICAEDIDGVHEYMKACGKLKPQTIYRYLVQLKVIFNFAFKRDDIMVHPYNRFVMPPHKKVKHHAPSNEQIVLMIKESEGTLLHLPILLAVMLGLRRGEVMGLQYDDFNFEAGSVHIQRQVTNTSKTKAVYEPTELKTESSDRTLMVPESLLQMIADLKEKNPEHTFIVAKENGERYTPVYIMGLYRKFCDKLGLQVRFHDLRHAYGTICLNNKIPIKAISDTMGHSDIKVTSNVYCDTRELLSAPAEVMEQAFGSLIQK